MLFLKKIQDINNKFLFFSITLIILIGQIINFFDSYSLFFIHQMILICISILSWYSIKKMFMFFKEVFPTPSTNTQLNSLIEKSSKRLESKWCIVISLVVVAIYFSSIFLMDYIQLNSIGTYAFILGSVALFLSIVGYCMFIIILIFVHSIKKTVTTFNYEIYCPANTSWLVAMTKFLHKVRTIFLILGLLFVTEYAILIPKNIKNLKLNLIFKSYDHLAFIITWMGIFVFIVMAFPIISIFIRSSIKRIVAELKQKTLEELNVFLNFAGKGKNYSEIAAYITLIERVEKTPSYPLSMSVPKNSIIIPLLTISVHSLKILSTFDWKKIIF